MAFFQALIFAIVTLLLAGGVIYWIFFAFKKIFPDFKYDLKYKVFRKKYNEKDIKRLMDYLQVNMTTEQVMKFLLLNGIDLKRCREMSYIYKQMHHRKLKGGENYVDKRS